MTSQSQSSVVRYPLSVHLWGKRKNTPLLLLHGFMGSGRDWEPIAQQLAKTHFVIAPDLPGHGGSHFNDPKQFTMVSAARLVVDLLDELKIERCVSVGYSMGGRTALYLATHYPNRFLRVILESASPGLQTEAEQAARRKWDAKIANRLEVEAFDSFLRSWYQMGLFDSFRAHSNYEHAFEHRLNNHPQQLALSMRMMGTGSMPSLWKGWGKVGDTVLIVGELDTKYVDISAKMQQLNPIAIRHIIPNVGHNTHFEAPRKFLSLLQSLL